MKSIKITNYDNIAYDNPPNIYKQLTIVSEVLNYKLTSIFNSKTEEHNVTYIQFRCQHPNQNSEMVLSYNGTTSQEIECNFHLFYNLVQELLKLNSELKELDVIDCLLLSSFMYIENENEFKVLNLIFLSNFFIQLY